MVDVVDAVTRSRMMGGIRGKNTKPEIRLRKALHRIGLRFRLHDRHLPGSPDLVFPKWRAVVFVHGCFWHQHSGCRFATMPATRTDFWRTKFDSNLQRDRRQIEELEQLGWRVATTWECSLKTDETVAEAAAELLNWLHSSEPSREIEARQKA